MMSSRAEKLEQSQASLELSRVPIDATINVISDNISQNSQNDHQNTLGFVNKAFEEDISEAEITKVPQPSKSQTAEQIEEITKILDEEDAEKDRRKDAEKDRKTSSVTFLGNRAMTTEEEGDPFDEHTENPATDETDESSRWQSSTSNNIMNLNQIIMMLDKANIHEDEERQMKLKKLVTPDYLILAVRNDSPQLVERLLDRSKAESIFHALMFSINLDRDHITMKFLQHPKYEQVRQMSKLVNYWGLDQVQTEETKEKLAKETAGTDEDDAVFSSDVTPIMLAAQRNQFDVVKSLLEKGETIHEPHPYMCPCYNCTKKIDKLRQAKTKLNAYKALASDAYIVLAHEDPIIACFERGQELRKLATKEKHFKASYLALAEQCSVLASKLLDRVRDGEELDTLLNEKAGSTGLAAYENLARLKLAIHYREKKFVAHPACQKKLASLWFKDLDQSWIKDMWRAFVFLVCLTLLYPFLAVVYWIQPKNKIGRFLRIPLVKFAAATCSYIIFLALVIGYTATEERSSGHMLSDDLPWSLIYLNMTLDYLNMTNGSSNPFNRPIENQTINGSFYPFNRPIEEIELRAHIIGFGTYTLSIWLLGLIWENIKRMYQERSMYFTENAFNLLDFILLVLFIISFSFRFAALGLVHTSMEYFKREQSWIDLANNQSEAEDKFYWLDADRSSWRASDPSMIAEAIFAVASLMSVCKLTHVFTISERIGPLLISLARMIQDVFAFMVIFIFIMAAFVIGFHNLFWYFYEVNDSMDDKESVQSFSSFKKVIETCFWSIFGLVEMDESMFHTFDSGQVTTITGHVMYAFYNWLMIIILINMLIAMMSRSYTFIAEMEDIEWKYARTKLFLEYIRDDSTLAVPFNLMPTWRGVHRLYKKMSDNWCHRCAGRPVKENNRANQKSTDTMDNSQNQSHTKMSNGDNNQDTITSPSARKNSKCNAKRPSEQYKLVIQKVVARFIQQHGKGKLGNSDDLDQLKQDMSTLRQELMTNLFNQENKASEMDTKIDRMQNQLQVSQTLDKLHHRDLLNFQDSTSSALRQFQHDMDAQMRDVHTSLQILKDGLLPPGANVTMMRGRNALSRDVITKQEAAGSQEVAARFEGMMSDSRRYDDYGQITVTSHTHRKFSSRNEVVVTKWSESNA